MAIEPQYVCGADMDRLYRRERNEVRARNLRPTAPRPTRRKKSKSPLLGGVCLLTTGGLIRVRHCALAQTRLRQAYGAFPARLPQPARPSCFQTPEDLSF